MVAAAVYVSSDILPSVKEGEIALFDKNTVVSQTDDMLFGNIMFKTENNLSLSKAYVLINGEKAGNLGSGSLLIRVHPGDIVSIDSSAYRRELTYCISAVSSNIDSSFLAGDMAICGKTVDVGIVVFK